ncbi:MAG: hypothetical protein ACPGYV_12710 [Phycisphaeraceae bacterium]
MPKLFRILALLWIALMLGINFYTADKSLLVERGHGWLPNGQPIAFYHEENLYTFGWPFKIVDEQGVDDFSGSIDGDLLFDLLINLGIWFWAPGTLWFFARHMSKNIRDSAGLCPQCNYNCTGVESPECPECGYESPPEINTTLKKPTP